MHPTILQYSAVLAQIINAALVIAGAAAVVLAGISKYRDKRSADMSEVMNRWKDLAEVTKAENVALEERLADAQRQNDEKDEKIEALYLRTDYLWTALEKLIDKSQLSPDRGQKINRP